MSKTKTTTDTVDGDFTPAPNPKTPGQLLREGEAALWLNISVKTLQNWRVSGRGPVYFKVGGSVRYSETTIRGFLDSCIKASTSSTGEA